MVTNFEFVFQKNNMGIGRRKQSTARVFLNPGTGKLIINNTAGEKYLQYNTIYLTNSLAPLKILGLEDKYDIIVLTKGGGLTGQADSIKLGLARILADINPENRSILKSAGFLTRDARIKERKKYGLRKARKAGQYSKR
jgi:small subunit ribosomal protein S9|tara:strand:+ start:234 stop:650 length:417 start_codon:yes stop_codon:yes gene_type:complete